jgi:dynein heavy chain
MDYTVVEIEISKTYGKNEWREDLKRLLTTAGGDGKSAELTELYRSLSNTCNATELPF